MMSEMLLPTTVIGSYSLPKWLEVCREAHKRGDLTDAQLEEAHDNAVKSCLKDQELAGLDIVTDGELRRETMVYFFAAHIKGFRLYGPPKPIGTLRPDVQMPDPVCYAKVERGDLGKVMAQHFTFAQQHSTKKVKLTCTGPHMLAKRCHNEAYRSDRDLVFDLAEILHEDLKEVVKAGCDFIQIDEPVWVGYPEELPWCIEALNRMVDGLDAKITLHICYGNYQRQRLFPGWYRDLFPAVLEARCSQFVFEFAINDLEGFETLWTEFPPDRELGIGVVDVKSDDVETPQQVAARIRRALKVFPPEKLYVNPDCGFKFTRRDTAFAKLKAMVEGTQLVRRELAG